MLICIGIVIVSSYCTAAFAQSESFPPVPLIKPIDSTLKAPLVNTVNNEVRAAKDLLPKSQLSGATAAEKKLASQVSDKLNNGLAQIKSQAISFNVALQNSLQYQPISNPDQAYQKFADIVGLTGTIQMFGVPLNVNISSSQSRGAMTPGFNNTLFKFDFDPKQLANSMQSDWQRFYSLQRNAFGGASLTEYSQKLINDQLKDGQQSLTHAFANPVISKIVNNPAQLNQLMTMNESDIKKTLFNKLKQSATDRQALLAAAQNLKIVKATDKLNIVSDLTHRPDLVNYLHDPATLKQLSTLSESQIKDKLSEQLKSAGPENTVPYKKSYGVEPITGWDFSDMINRYLEQKKQTQDAFLTNLSHQIAGRNLNAADADKLLNGQLNNYKAQLAAEAKENATGTTAAGQVAAVTDVSKDVALKEEVNKVAGTIGQIQKQLGTQGYDVKRLLQMQGFVEKGFNVKTMSEAQQNLFSRNPTTSAQSLLTKFSALKVGSFAIEAPGGTQNQDIFMNGAHATVKLGYAPITIGYGSQNDVQSSKDAEFNSTVYSSPRNLTYLSTDLKRGGLKISVIGSVNKQYSYSGYAMPTLSSNNVALTLSKNYHMGKLGDAVVDISKATTLYANKYDVGNEAVLDKKAGLTNYGTDLFESLSFSVNHHLDITQLGMSDNVYFSYAGTGYQNPGNNGSAGAQMKVGGALKKSFYKKKLTLNFRTDVRNQPISYTTNDQWRNLQLQLDSRYIVNKKINIALKYINNNTNKRVDNAIQPVYSFQKIQFDGNATYKIGRNYSVSHFTIGGEQLANTYVNATTTNILLMNYTQTLLVKQRAITFNAFYNKEMSTNTLIGNIFNADLSYQLPITKKIDVTTGITYLDNAGIARQAGIRETFRFISIKNFDIGSFIDLRKNLITPQYADLYAATRAELTVKYHLKY